MSKRPHSELDGSDLDTTAALARVDEILLAASQLKRELEALHDSRKNQDGDNTPSVVPATLQQSSSKIIDSVTQLSEQFAKDHSPSDSEPRKSQKLNGPDARPSVPKELSLPSPASLTAWTLQDIPPDGKFPPLPSVADSLLEKASLTHTGMTAKAIDLSYEKLEWIGDAYLYLMSSAFIFQTFPLLSVGRSVQLRERLVKNDTLREYTLSYGLNRRANFPAEFDLHGRSGGSSASNKVKNKVLGDIFESYFAAIILGNPGGLEMGTAFIKRVWSVTLASEIRKECKAQEQHHCQAAAGIVSAPRQELNHKVELAKTIGGANIYIDYRQIGEKKLKDSSAPLYTMGVYLTGWGESDLQLGHGSALSKKDAGQKAAAAALENKKLIKRLAGVRSDFLKAVAAQKEHQRQ